MNCRGRGLSTPPAGGKRRETITASEDRPQAIANHKHAKRDPSSGPVARQSQIPSPLRYNENPFGGGAGPAEFSARALTHAPNRRRRNAAVTVSDSPTQQATIVLSELTRGDSSAAERLLPLVYAELRSLAGSYFRAQPADHTLQPTALVHEAFIRLIDQTSVEWNDRAHFFAVAATAMRQILTDHARRSKALKRGGDRERVSLENAPTPAEKGEVDLVALDEILTKLEGFDPRKHRILELRFFGGLSVEEVARILEVSKTTVENEWRAARAWLNYELSKGERA